MTNFPRAFLDTLRASNRLSDVASPTLKLVQCGHQWKASCPVYKEDGQSFVVDDEKGFFHCFGCGAHGDIIDFLMRVRGMTFVGSVVKLAAMAGLPMPKRADSLAGGVIIKLEIGMPVKKGGAKLGRSETVTVRLDPKLNYLSELAARAQRRTKSSFIEWAIAESLKSVTLPETQSTEAPFEEREATLRETASQLWHVDEPDRVAALAIVAPALLTHEEQLVWRLVRENGHVWKGCYNNQDEWAWTVKTESLIKDRLREHWEAFKGVALGDASKDSLPSWNKHRAKKPATFDSDLDDDVPF